MEIDILDLFFCLLTFLIFASFFWLALSDPFELK